MMIPNPRPGDFGEIESAAYRSDAALVALKTAIARS